MTSMHLIGLGLGRGVSLFIVALVTAIAGSLPTHSAPFELTVQLKWRHQAQFAGNYVADQKGYYADEGLKVRFIAGGPGIDINGAVISGGAQVGINAAAQLVSLRADGAPVVAISTIYQRSPVVFVSKKEKGIASPRDFKGRTIRLPGSHKTEFLAVLKRVGVSPDDLNFVMMPSSIEAWEAGGADVWSVYLIGFLSVLERQGYDLNIIFPDDYGVHFYAGTIFMTEAFAAEHPDVLTRFLRATIRGWEYAVAHPQEAVGLISPYNLDMNLSVETAKLSSSIPLIMIDLKRVGWMEISNWRKMEETLSQLGILKERVDIDAMVTTQFLPEN